MLPYPIERIYVDERAEKDWVTEKILRSLSHLPVERVCGKKELIKRFLFLSDPLGMGKKNLLITHDYGRRVKPCPGTSNHICCGYYVINPMTNCPMDCSYCVLQEYLNNPLLTLYSNIDDLLEEVFFFLSMKDRTLLRLGTGELSDSLALESIFPISQILIPIFAEREDAILELKTKSVNVDSLLSLNHRGKTVLSWSLNPPQIIEKEEKGTAPLKDRLEAAKRCQAEGYPLGFHFDPILIDEGWESAYAQTIETLFKTIDTKRIVWISLGGFRYPPKLKGIAEERFPETRIFLGELFPGKDLKFRYLKEIRIEVYRKVVRWVKEVDPDLFIYLCMESQEVWQRVFGWSPKNSRDLSRMFERRLKAFISKS
ncbi:MAG: radical SAM protein [Thermodesulfobacteriota bacterium]